MQSVSYEVTYIADPLVSIVESVVERCEDEIGASDARDDGKRQSSLAWRGGV